MPLDGLTLPDVDILADSPELRRALARRDVGALYRALLAEGWTQRRIAEAVRQSQGEICDIVAGRRMVEAYDVLLRICENLGIPRGWMGLSYGDWESEPPPEVDLDENMKRRVLMGVASLALFGAPVLGEVLELGAPRPSPTPLPARLTSGDATALRGVTTALRSGARAMGGCGQIISETANKSLRLLAIPAPDEVSSDIRSAIAEMHTLAGWTCVDSGLHDAARYHFVKAMEIAKSAGDTGALADALWHAGLQMVDAGADNDGLKAFQLGLTAADWKTDHVIVNTIMTTSASALARLGERDSALRTLRQAEDFSPNDLFDSADLDYVRYRIHFALGDIDKSAEYAGSAVRKWRAEGKSARDSIESEIALAELHVRTGSSDGPGMAYRAMSKAAQLSSVRARRVKLPPLVAAVQQRGNSELVQLGHRVINS